jgi:hypothetical protein
MTHIKKFGAALLLAFVAAVSARAGDATVGRATGVKVLLVGDTNAFPGGDAASDINTVEARLKGLPGFDPDRDLRKLTGDDVTAENILRAVDDLDVQPTDALFFYYEGHGAYDPDLADGDSEGGHFLAMPSGDLRRSELMQHLKDKGARLTVCITEVCNVAATFHADPYEVVAPEPTEDRSVKDVATVTSASLERLLFDFTGVVDVNAADQGQSSWSTQQGGWFTQSFLQTLDDDDQLRGVDDPLSPGLTNLNRQLWKDQETWASFLDRVSKKTHEEYQDHHNWAVDHPSDNNQDLRDQEDQRPDVFQLEVQAAEDAPPKDDDFVPPSPFGPDGGLKDLWPELPPAGK